MKFKLLIILILLVPAIAAADWELTVSGWTMSAGPNLAYEEVLLDDTVICANILPANNKSCVHTFPTKTNQVVTVRSFDADENYADNIIGNIGSGPNPSSGGSFTFIWK